MIDAILERASQVKDPRKRDKYTRAALQTGIVESGLQNLNHGDADSEGWRQERKSLYPDPTNVKTSVDRFFNEAAQLDKGQASWQLAADVQRPAAQYRGRYKDVASQAAALLKGAGASQPAGSGSTPVAAPGSSGSGQAAAPVLGDPGQAPDVTSLLASLLSRPAQAAPAVQVDRPQFAAAPTLPGGVQLAAPQSLQGPQQAGGVDDALSLLGSLRGTDPAVAAPVAGDAGSVGQEPVAVTVRKQRASMKAAGFPTSRAYPVGVIGKIIGTPNSGTHTLGNWQSDNAVDIGVKAGTPMLALQDGVVVKVTKHPQGSGRFAGDQITIRGANGNEYFYGHGVAGVKAGQKIRRGESLGVTGSANGVDHLHFGQMRGDPRGHTIT